MPGMGGEGTRPLAERARCFRNTVAGLWEAGLLTIAFEVTDPSHNSF